MKSYLYLYMSCFICLTSISSCKVQRPGYDLVNIEKRVLKRDERKILTQFYSLPIYKKDNNYHIFYFFYVNYNGRFDKIDFLNDSYLRSLWYMKKSPSKKVSVFIDKCYIIDNKNRIVAEWDRLIGVHEPYHLNEIIRLSSIIEDYGVLY